MMEFRVRKLLREAYERDGMICKFHIPYLLYVWNGIPCNPEPFGALHDTYCRPGLYERWDAFLSLFPVAGGISGMDP